jgi:hypothetical protein
MIQHRQLADELLQFAPIALLHLGLPGLREQFDQPPGAELLEVLANLRQPLVPDGPADALQFAASHLWQRLGSGPTSR